MLECVNIEIKKLTRACATTALALVFQLVICHFVFSASSIWKAVFGAGCLSVALLSVSLRLSMRRCWQVDRSRVFGVLHAGQNVLRMTAQCSLTARNWILCCWRCINIIPAGSLFLVLGILGFQCLPKTALKSTPSPLPSQRNASPMMLMMLATGPCRFKEIHYVGPILRGQSLTAIRGTTQIPQALQQLATPLGSPPQRDKHLHYSRMKLSGVKGLTRAVVGWEVESMLLVAT